MGDCIYISPPMGDELGLLHVPSTRRKSFGDRAFLKAGPTLWNLVPCEIRLSPSLDSFKTNLKTFLYRDAYINNTYCFYLFFK